MCLDSFKCILKVHLVLSLALFLIDKLKSYYFFCSCKPRKSYFLFNGQTFSSSLIIICLTALIQSPFYKKLLQKERDEKKVEKDDEEGRRRRKEQKRLYHIKCLIGLALSSTISLFTWLALWYSNGEYYVCQQSDWNGLWTHVSNTPLKWCGPRSDILQKPPLSGLDSSATWYIESQVCF